MSRYKVFLIFALLYFLWRGPVRWFHNLNHYNDFAVSYINGRAWLHGENPYTVDSFRRMWREGGGVNQFAEFSMRTSVALPSSVPFSAALSWLSWIRVTTLLLLCSLAAFAVMVGTLYRLYGLSSCVPAAFFLSLTAFHLGVVSQNIASILIPLIVLSLWLVENGHEASAGIMLGFGTCYKPQLVLIVVAFLLVKKRWKAGLACFAVVGAALVTFLVFAQSGTVAAFHNRLAAFGSGGPDDFALANPARYELINLQLIPASFGASRFTCNVIAWSVCILLSLYWYFQTERAIEPIVLIGLLPFYHRYVDAGLLVLPLAFALKHRPRLAWLSLPFFAPVPVVLFLRLGDRGPLWDAFVLCHQVWLLLAFSIGLLAWTSKAADARALPQSTAG